MIKNVLHFIVFHSWQDFGGDCISVLSYILKNYRFTRFQLAKYNDGSYLCVELANHCISALIFLTKVSSECSFYGVLQLKCKFLMLLSHYECGMWTRVLLLQPAADWFGSNKADLHRWNWTWILLIHFWFAFFSASHQPQFNLFRKFTKKPSITIPFFSVVFWIIREWNCDQVF